MQSVSRTSSGLLRIADGTAVREWRIPEQMYFLGNGHFTTVN